jgi:RecJ-like exonuclease
MSHYSPNGIVVTFTISKCHRMNENTEKIKELFNRIPRRHTADNVKEMYSILDAYEDLLMSMEADDRYEKQVPVFFEALDPIRATIKKSNDNKASKKTKDVLFDEASGALKDTIQELMQL